MKKGKMWHLNKSIDKYLKGTLFVKVNTFLKELLFSTVRIIADDGKSVGTGFLTSEIINDKRHIFLVSNKHVIAVCDGTGKIVGKFSKIVFHLLKKNGDNPALGNSIPITIQNGSDSFIFHPDMNVDLAIINITDVINKIILELKQDVFIKSIPVNLIPGEKDNFDSIEEIYFVGYPTGLSDEKNHLPITRKGITASPFEIDFSGNKKFLIDAHVFPGSSGSPIFIKEQSVKGSSVRLGSERYFFVGIISGVYRREEIGTIIKDVAPTGLNIVMQQMIGLGICEKSSQLISLIEMANQKNAYRILQESAGIETAPKAV